MPAIFDNLQAVMASAYPARAFLLKHRLRDHPLFTLSALADLARRLPAGAIEYNAGDILVDQPPDKTPQTGLSIDDTLKRIDVKNSWMAFRHVEQDDAYRAALEECLAEIAPCAAKTTGAMHKKQGFIFVSSANAVTPLHFDPEHNILIHLQGRKRIMLYQSADIVPDEYHERFHAGAAHRNLCGDTLADAQAEAYDLEPGDAVYVPVKTPHWVRTGDEPCISFSITWRSRASDAEARLRIANHYVRKFGGAPPPPGDQPARDAAAVFAQRVAARLTNPFG